jgi:hypothetical protein
MKTNQLFTRLIISLSFVLAAFIQPAARVFAQPQVTPNISVSPDSSMATTCATWQIAIQVSDVVGLTAYHLEISFDPGYLNILGIQNGGFLNGGLYEKTNAFNNTTGTLTFGMAQLNDAAQTMTAKDGSGNLIIITVQAVKPGGTVHFTIDPTNSVLVNWPDLQATPFTATNGTVTTQSCAPTDITLSNNSVLEDQPVGTEIGTFTTTDPDLNDTFTYTLVNDSTYPDNTNFKIVGDKLETAVIFHYAANLSYSIMVRSTDSGGLYYEKVFTIFITEHVPYIYDLPMVCKNAHPR